MSDKLTKKVVEEGDSPESPPQPVIVTKTGVGKYTVAVEKFKDLVNYVQNGQAAEDLDMIDPAHPTTVTFEVEQKESSRFVGALLRVSDLPRKE